MMAKDTSEGGIVETIKTVFWALVIAIGFRSVFFQPFWIPSESMKDTLLIGDFLFVNKMAYGYSRYSCPFSLCPISGRLFGSDPERRAHDKHGIPGTPERGPVCIHTVLLVRALGSCLRRNDGEGEPASTVTRAHPVSPAEAGAQCVFTQSSS